MQALCQKQYITGFPSVRVYRKGSDKVITHGFPSHEAYHGDRTTPALEKFIDGLVDSAGKDANAARIPFTRRMTLAEGCQVRVAAACCPGMSCRCRAPPRGVCSCASCSDGSARADVRLCAGEEGAGHDALPPQGGGPLLQR